MKHCIAMRDKRKKHYTAQVPVSDDWFPNCENNTITLTWHPKEGRISAWGDDDYGMEKTPATFNQFLKLKKQILSAELLKSLGFTPA